MRRRVLVLTRDLIPTGRRPVSGGGLRAWGLGEALRSRGHEVAYSVPRQLVPDGEEYAELRRLAFEPDELHKTLLRAEPELLIVEQWGLATYLVDPAVPVVLDLHGSLILENAFRRHRTLTSNAAAKIKALQKADLVLCPARCQRAYFMTWLMMSGADPTEIPIEVVPVSLPPELPARTADYDGPLRLVFGGQLWPWIESDTALALAAEELERRGNGTCHLFVAEPRHDEVLPFDESTQVQARPLSPRITQSSAVRLEGLVPHEELLRQYAGAHLAIDVYARNSERELAFTTRTVEYLWCGLPVIYGDYGELAQLIAEYEAGWTVSPADASAIRGALEHALSDPAELRRRSENAQRLVRERLTWDRTVEPLDRFVRDPVVREKGTTIFGKLALEFDRIDSETREQMRGLGAEVRRLAGEVAARDANLVELNEQVGARERRIADLMDELARRDRLLAEQTDRLGRFSAEWDRERRAHADQLAALQREHETTERHLARARELLRCEQDDHAQTSARLESTGNEAAVLGRRLEEKEQELTALRTDLSGAVDRIADGATKYEARIESLEKRLMEVSLAEQDARRELAAEAARSDGQAREVARQREDAERLRLRIKSLEETILGLKDHWIQRSVATGELSLRRVVSQVPAIAGLFVRNLANNAYMAVWQKRHNVRIFPGQ